ncbi:MAG: helix-turn-helix transcriptional regulator [Deltaproteobacteria bacterium]|nr:helix-turn-helix transcriptional regulator [Deltaproteobacteria bacterium]
MPKTDISILVKSLRRRLALTQEQFAREVGITFSTVNQWENGRRRPQPFLLNRLREMEAALESPRGGLTSAAARAFQDRWQMVNKAERQELRAATLARKLKQLAALLASIPALKPDHEAREEEEAQVRRQWARLRQVYHAGTHNSHTP